MGKGQKNGKNGRGKLKGKAAPNAEKSGRSSGGGKVAPLTKAQQKDRRAQDDEYSSLYSRMHSKKLGEKKQKRSETKFTGLAPSIMEQGRAQQYIQSIERAEPRSTATATATVSVTADRGVRGENVTSNRFDGLVDDDDDGAGAAPTAPLSWSLRPAAYVFSAPAAPAAPEAGTKVASELELSAIGELQEGEVEVWDDDDL
jgi:hypothetical protein